MPSDLSEYQLAFLPAAMKEWKQLDNSVKRLFKSKLEQRLQEPRVSKDSLKGLADCYKIKITRPQFRLAYQVNEAERVVTVLGVNSRDVVYD